MVELARRSFITSLVAFGIGAPAIVRAGSLMAVKQVVWTSNDIVALLERRLDAAAAIMARNLSEAIYGDVMTGGSGDGLRRLLPSYPLEQTQALFPYREVAAGFSLNG
jgi:hypothetical protein